MLITEIRQYLWWSDQLHKEWWESQGAWLSFHPRMGSEFIHAIRFKGVAGNKSKVAFWSVAIHEPHYFGGDGRILEGNRKTGSWALKMQIWAQCPLPSWVRDPWCIQPPGDHSHMINVRWQTENKIQNSEENLSKWSGLYTVLGPCGSVTWEIKFLTSDSVRLILI